MAHTKCSINSICLSAKGVLNWTTHFEVSILLVSDSEEKGGRSGGSVLPLASLASLQGRRWKPQGLQLPCPLLRLCLVKGWIPQAAVYYEPGRTASTLGDDMKDEVSFPRDSQLKGGHRYINGAITISNNSSVFLQRPFCLLSQSTGLWWYWLGYACDPVLAIEKSHSPCLTCSRWTHILILSVTTRTF